MKNAILAIVVILLVVVGGIIYSNNSPETTEEAPDQTETEPENNKEQPAAQNPAPAPVPAPSPQPTPVTPPAPAQVTVKYTQGRGFEPKTITVKVGDRVKWVNETDEPMWVGSDPHPIHNGYLGFDEKSAAGIGGTYTFIFTKAGSWGYHNHLAPQDRGAVIVQ